VSMEAIHRGVKEVNIWQNELVLWAPP